MGHQNNAVKFVIPRRGFSGRVDLKTWSKRGFKGKFEGVKLYRVTKGYYFDKTQIWTGIGKWENELSPHRFDFDRKPALNLRNIQISKLTVITKSELHSMIHNNLVSGSPSSLVEFFLL